MWRLVGDLMRNRNPGGALAVLIPGSFVFGLVFAPWWVPWAEWIMEHRIGALAVAFLAGVLLGLVLLRRHRRQLHELRRDPIHRWPPLPRDDLSFIRSKLMKH